MCLVAPLTNSDRHTIMRACGGRRFIEVPEGALIGAFFIARGQPCALTKVIFHSEGWLILINARRLKGLTKQGFGDEKNYRRLLSTVRNCIKTFGKRFPHIVI